MILQVRRYYVHSGKRNRSWHIVDVVGEIDPKIMTAICGRDPGESWGVLFYGSTDRGLRVCYDCLVHKGRR